MNYIAKITKNAIGAIALITVAVFAAVAQRPGLTGTKWQLTHIDGRALATNKAFLEFDTIENRFAGNAGCNRMFGDVKVSGRRVDFGAVATTKMACVDTASNRIERSFISKLENIKRFRITNSTLELLDGGRTLLLLEAAKAENLRLESKKWLVYEIAGKAVRKKGEMPFVVFDSSISSAGGNTGCNVFGGSYEVSGSKIRIFDTVSTLRACVEDERMTLERQFLDALQTANRFEISGNKLDLYRNSNLLIKFNGVPK